MSARVHQVLSGAGPYDAITNQALAYQSRFEAWGWGGQVFACAREPAVKKAVQGIERLERTVREGDLVAIHYSAHPQALDRVLELPHRKLLVYHNITPALYLWDYEPHVAVLCALAQDRLAGLAEHVALTMTASQFNAADLHNAGFDDVRVIPNLYFLDRARLSLGAQTTSWADGKQNVIFVGRLSANKRQDRLIKAFALYQRYCEPNSRLILVGSPGNGAYRDYLVALTAELDVRDVVLTGALSQPEVNAIYAAAAALVCLSEHEGFCLPLLEALHFGIPVLALRAGAVPEVLGEAGLILDEPDLPTIAEAIDVCVRSQALRAELRRRGAEQLEQFAPARTEAALRQAVELGRR